VLVEIRASFVDRSEPLDEQRHRQWVQTTHEAFGAMALPGGYPNLPAGRNPERAAKSYRSNVERSSRLSGNTIPITSSAPPFRYQSVSTRWPPNPRAVEAGRPAPYRSGARATRSGGVQRSILPQPCQPEARHVFHQGTLLHNSSRPRDLADSDRRKNPV
jgi:hypothetical protein